MKVGEMRLWQGEMKNCLSVYKLNGMRASSVEIVDSSSPLDKKNGNHDEGHSLSDKIVLAPWHPKNFSLFEDNPNEIRD